MSDYPTDEELKTIESWDVKDLDGLMAYIKPIWKYSDCGYWEEGSDGYVLHTAGWSDNEEIIGRMMHNHVWWMLYWYQSTRGGHYIFMRREKND